MDMNEARVSFSRVVDNVEMILEIGGEVITRSASQESVARELQIHNARRLSIEGMFSTELPTSPKTLDAAASIPFSELMTALKLLAACASMDEPSTMPFPERRAKPRAEKRLGSSRI